MRRRHRGGNDPWSEETGSFSLELAILFPVFLLLILLLVQTALYFFARSIASSAAQQGADIARLQGNTPSDGASAATTFISQQGGGILGHLAVNTTGSTPADVNVSVTGRVITLVPGLDLSVTQAATAPRERYTTATAGTGTPP